jgi:cytochrome b561
MPVTGILMTIYRGRPVESLGLTIPAQAEWPWLAGVAGSLHSLGAIALLALVILHVGAALKHHVIEGDATLRRIIVGR